MEGFVYLNVVWVSGYLWSDKRYRNGEKEGRGRKEKIIVLLLLKFELYFI